MAGIIAHGTSASFIPVTDEEIEPQFFVVTRFSFNPPAERLTDMTSVDDLIGANKMVGTGEREPGSISLEFIAAPSFSNPQIIIGQRGPLVIEGPYGITRNVVCAGGSVDATVGDVVRGSLQFTISDYYGEEE